MKYNIIDRMFLTSVIVAAIGGIGLIMYVATRPSCSDRGGTLTMVGGTYVTNLVGKVPVTSWSPIYACTGAHK